MPRHSKNSVSVWSLEPVETLTGLRSWGGVPVTQSSSLKKMPRYRDSPKGVLFLFKVSKMTNFNYDLFKVSKMTKFD